MLQCGDEKANEQVRNPWVPFDGVKESVDFEAKREDFVTWNYDSYPEIKIGNFTFLGDLLVAPQPEHHSTLQRP